MLFKLSRLFGQIGNDAEQKRHLTYTLELWRRQGNDSKVAQTLRCLADVNRLLRLHKEGIQQAKKALEIYEWIDDTKGQTRCLKDLALVLFSDKQLDAAENAASRAINLVPEKGQEHSLCVLHRILGKIYQSKGENRKPSTISRQP